MSHSQRWTNWVASCLLLLAAASCEGAGCGGIALEPLPTGGLPPDQTIEGAVQIRITAAGLDTIESVATTLLNDALDGGFCLPPTGAVGVDLCTTTDGVCDPGCQVNMAINSIDLSALTVTTLRVRVQFDVNSNMHVDAGLLGTCTLGVRARNARITVDLPLRIDPTTGVLVRPSIDSERQVSVSFPNLELTGCSIISDILEALSGAILSLLDGTIRGIISAQLEAMLRSVLPDPLGLEGVLDLGGLLGAISPGTEARIELRALPGGFASLPGGGLTVGGILGINSDRDPSTRTRDLDSEPARCVPSWPAPDLSAPPASLSTTSRGTYFLAAADEFRGAPDPVADVVIGLSQTALALAGHHAVTSGALCLNVGTTLIPALNLGAIGLLVPSLGLLGQGDEPLLLSTRPAMPLGFTVGAGTADSPSLTLHLRDLEVDLYAFLYERYVRVFTLRLNADVGLGLELTTTATGAPAILPVLSGLSAKGIQVTAHNAEFLRESEEDIEAVMPAVLDLALSLLGNLGPIELPSLAGVSLGSLRIARVITDDDVFLTILASLELPATAAALRSEASSWQSGDTLDAGAPARARTRASLARVVVPAPEHILAGLRGAPGGQVPEVVVDVATRDERGRALEHTWRVNGGMWQSFTSEERLVIREPALAVQGRHRIELRSRVVGDYRTLDLAPVVLPVLIDSVGPEIVGPRAHVDQGRLVVPTRDLVSPAGAIEMAFASPGQAEPATAWAPGGLPVDEARRLAAGGMLQVFARDEAGNVASLEVNVAGALRRGSQGCSAGGGQAGGLLVLASLGMLFLARVRRAQGARVCLARVAGGGRARGLGAALVPVLLLSAGALVASAGMAGCGGKVGDGPPAGTCERHEDCDGLCTGGTVGFCLENRCECVRDLPLGRIGQDSDMVLLPSGEVWVSAYNSLYGDLTVARRTGEGPIEGDAWTFVDGVPAGPVAIERSQVRGGVRDHGEDVGRYTSITAAPDGTVMVSYYDAGSGSLRFAAHRDGAWQTHIVDAGMVPDGESPAFALVGQYSSITVRNDDGRPGIAYFAHITEADGTARTEVRFASARIGVPEGPEDWFFYVVDTVALPPVDQQASDPHPIPPGVGLFLSSTRAGDRTPVLAYYDRVNGALKMARFDLVAGVFTAPELLDGGDGRDVGWYPSVGVDADGEVHVSYMGVSQSALLYVNTIDRVPVVVDDGYREAGVTENGLVKPVLHRVGNDSSLVMTSFGPVIAYQDATTRELLLARKLDNGFERQRVAGGRGSAGYGFYTATAYTGGSLVISNWVVDPAADRYWIQIHRWPLSSR